jgi:hypothetical protein
MAKSEKSRTAAPLKLTINQSVQFFLWILSGFPQLLVHFSSFYAFAFCSIKFLSADGSNICSSDFFSLFCLGYFQSLYLLLFSLNHLNQSFYYFTMMETCVACHQQIRVNCLRSSRTADSS